MGSGSPIKGRGLGGFPGGSVAKTPRRTGRLVDLKQKNTSQEQVETDKPFRHKSGKYKPNNEMSDLELKAEI